MSNQKKSPEKDMKKLEEKPAADGKTPAEGEDKKPEAPKKVVTLLQELVAELVAWEKAVYLKDAKACFRSIRNLRRSKKNVKAHHLIALFNFVLNKGPNTSVDLTASDDFDKNFAEKPELPPNQFNRLSKNPEVEIYLNGLLLVYLMKKKHHKEAFTLCEHLLRATTEANKRYLDNFRALLFFYWSRLHELKHSLKAIRNDLFEAYRTSCINRDEIGQAVLLNLLLRNFLHYNEYEAASNLISKTKFPENKFNNEHIRYLYYKGRVRAVQAEYQEAFSLLQQAIRKAPENTGSGFKVAAQKLACIIELLVGDLPSRSIFSTPELRKPLFPYFKIVKAVAVGNMEEFYAATKEHQAIFSKDKLLNLINRLHQNVIRTGLRKINLSYSRIALSDIASKLKLNLNSEKDVEFIVAKAIRDGTMNAYIDHDTKCVIIQEVGNVYDTQDPQNAFQKRIAYCLHVYSAAIKAHQYPESKLKLPTLEDRRSEIDEDELMNLMDDLDDL